jgi:hypothetical protein
LRNAEGVARVAAAAVAAVVAAAARVVVAFHKRLLDLVTCIRAVMHGSEPHAHHKVYDIKRNVI